MEIVPLGPGFAAELRGVTLAEIAADDAAYKEARAALYCTWQDAALLKQVIADPILVADGALGLSEFRRKSSLLAMSTFNRL